MGDPRVTTHSASRPESEAGSSPRATPSGELLPGVVPHASATPLTLATPTECASEQPSTGPPRGDAVYPLPTAPTTSAAAASMVPIEIEAHGVVQMAWATCGEHATTMTTMPNLTAIPPTSLPLAKAPSRQAPSDRRRGKSPMTSHAAAAIDRSATRHPQGGATEGRRAATPSLPPFSSTRARRPRSAAGC